LASCFRIGPWDCVTVSEEGAKVRAAREVLSAEDLALSVQVLQEFYVQATRPSRTGRLTHGQAAALIQSFLRFPVQESTLTLMRASLESTHRFRISPWDAGIIEAARILGCRSVLSEDLAHGRDYDGIKVENPFRPKRC